MGIDYDAVRNRIGELKVKSKLNNYDFCKIYAPERCEASKATAENYMSAVCTGRNYPKETSGPVKPELNHLQNLVDSDLFPGLTMNYLLYGDDAPARERAVLDLDFHHWALADFCEFLLGMMQEYSVEIKYGMSEPEKYEISFDNEEIIEETRYSLVLKFLEFDSFDNDGCDLGLGLRTFIEEFQKCQNITSSKARDVAIKEMMDAIRSDERYSKALLGDCHSDKRFIEYSYYGPQVKSLKID